jgi:hypothetical protein
VKPSCLLCRDACEIELRNGKGRAPCPRCQPERFLDALIYRYVANVPGAVSGQGGHTQTFKLALSLLKGFDLTIEQARPYLLEYNARCEPPWSAADLEHKLTSADSQPDERARGWLRPENNEHAPAPNERTRAAPPTPAPRAEFQTDKLAAFAARWRAFTDTAWLADRSAIDPCGVTAEQFLRLIYRPEERVLIFTSAHSQGQALWPLEKIPTRGPDGVWFLAQPVDGKSYLNPRSLDQQTGKPKMSRRSEESVTSWRFLVLESDKADARDWVGALVQLPLAIVAIYSSGGRSIHALVKVNAPNLAEWRRFSAAIRPALVTLGADQQVVSSAVRLTRLPGSFRGTRLQKLLYLNPEAKPSPICSLPRQRDVLAPIVREAQAILDTSAGDVLARAGAKNLDECIAALQEHEAIPRDLERCRRRLAWFENVPRARELLQRLA